MNTGFKYILDKRGFGHTPKKFLCPSCGKRTFVKYIDSETGHYVGDEFGRCDRERNCGYMQAPTAGTVSHIPSAIKEPVEPSFHPYELVMKSLREYMINLLFQFLITIFPEDQVREAFKKYVVGTSKDGSAVFWQMDNRKDSNEIVRGGKIMKYVKETGKRYKDSEGQGRVNWVHSVLKLEDYNLQQCLFGLHLINETDKKTIALVESEKTAIIMSLIEKDFVWLATGGSKNFKYEMLKPIKNFNIIAFPDKGEFQNWNKMAMSLNTRGFKIVVADNIENTDCPSGTDLADVVIKHLQEQKTKPVIDFSKYTDIEKKVYNLEQENPSLRLLIETFDLTDEFGRDIRKII